MYSILSKNGEMEKMCKSVVKQATGQPGTSGPVSVGTGDPGSASVQILLQAHSIIQGFQPAARMLFANTATVQTVKLK